MIYPEICECTEVAARHNYDREEKTQLSLDEVARTVTEERPYRSQVHTLTATSHRVRLIKRLHRPLLVAVASQRAASCILRGRHRLYTTSQQSEAKVEMFVWCLLSLLALLPVTTGINPGVEVKLTQKGLEYGRQMGIASIQKKLSSIKLPDISGTEHVDPIGKVQYSFTGMQIVNLGLPTSALGLVPGTGVSLSIDNAFINLHGNWRVKYLRIIKDSGSFDLAVSALTIRTTIAVMSDETGRPSVSMTSCTADVGSVKVKFHGGASWLYNLFSSYINKALGSALQKQICPLVAESIADVNPHLKTLNVEAKVDKYAEIEYSMVGSPVISNASIDIGLKGEFYNTGQHKEPPFSPAPFSLPSQNTNMLYFGVSAFTINSAGFVYHSAGALSLNITDDMIPSSSPIRLNTKTFGTFIPQIAKMYPGLMMKLLVKTVKQPIVTFQPNNVTVQTSGLVTAYAIQPNSTLSPLFDLNLDGSISARVYVTELKLAGYLTLNKIDMSLAKSYVGPFQVTSLENIFTMVLKVAVMPKVNACLKEGYPLPTIGKMHLVETQLQVLKDYLLVGTDVQFTE
ncbi:bactericidal permeability-increasing protein-like isoform X2 [Triplophysa rosa]|uniref:bactericidal permeability-increasing protein-like isoform X2 n=1 Tax=Triplophysa rosa TaxID=992332 RepID=UPI002545E872|nr:bactericidal permeability-increasing protein-like isoform X2 [Triplophysa rosa]